MEPQPIPPRPAFSLVPPQGIPLRLPFSAVAPQPIPARVPFAVSAGGGVGGGGGGGGGSAPAVGVISLALEQPGVNGTFLRAIIQSVSGTPALWAFAMINDIGGVAAGLGLGTPQPLPFDNSFWGNALNGQVPGNYRFAVLSENTAGVVIAQTPLMVWDGASVTAVL